MLAATEEQISVFSYIITVPVQAFQINFNNITFTVVDYPSEAGFMSPNVFILR